MLELTGQGNCKRLGFTEPAELGNATAHIKESLRKVVGPCHGVKVLKFAKRHQEEPAATPAAPPAAPPAEAPAEAPAAPPAEARAPEDTAPAPESPPKPRFGRTICGNGTYAFQQIKTAHGETTCTVFCVPAGRCLGRAQAGKLRHFGITEEGNCRKDGYTVRFGLGVEARNWVQHLYGPCAGMSLLNFKKPGSNSTHQAAVTSAMSIARKSKLCAGTATAYEAHSPLRPHLCSAFCVPEGACEGLVQSGKLNVGITAQGNCRGRGFTKPSTDYREMDANILDMLKGFSGACKGMTYTKFEKPAVQAQSEKAG